MLNPKVCYSLISFSFLLLFSTISMFVDAQNTNIELLKRNIELVDNDSVKMELLIKLGFQYIGADSEYAIFYLNQAGEIAQKLDHKRGMAMSKLYMGRAYYYSDKYDLSVDYYEEAYEILAVIQYIKGITEYYFFKGALQQLLAEYNNALESYHAGIRLAEENDDPESKAIFLNGIGKIHFYNKNMQTSLEYFKEALEIRRELNDRPEEATILSNIGEVYEYKAHFSEALRYYNEALTIRQTFGENRKTAVSYKTLGNLYTRIGRYNEADSNFTRALSIFNQLGEKVGYAGVLLDLSMLYRKMGKLNEAADFAMKSIKIAIDIENKNLESHAYKVQSEVYFVLENYRQAYASLVKHITIADSLFSIEEKKQLNNLETRYQIEAKNQRIQILNSKTRIQKQQLLILYVSITAMILAIGLLISFYRFKTVHLKQRNQLLEREKQIEHQQLAINERERKILAEKNEMQSKELVSKAILMNKTNEIIQQNILKLKQLSVKLGGSSKKEKKDITDIISSLNKYSSESLWDDFEVAFLNVHKGFYDNLFQICDDLTPAEIKIAALIRLNLSSKEIESITFKSESSIKSLRFRLRKKLELAPDQNLTAFLMKL